MRPSRPYTYLGTVTGMCRKCRQLVPARIIEQARGVFQEGLCPTCGPQRVRIADDLDWYLERTATSVRGKPSRRPGTPVVHGCPHDCGPCEFHANACHLPVFSVTNVCNLDCPICFTYNRPDRQYYMGREELRSLLDKLIDRAGPLDLINITGGEPTMHPDLLGLLEECQRPEIGRVTINSNGLRLATDEPLCQALAAAGAYVVLSFHTLQSPVAEIICGRDVVALKLQALKNLQKHGIGTTLLNVMIQGLNETEIGAVIRLAQNHSVVRSVTVQTMTYTGKGGGQFQPRQPLPLDGAARIIAQSTNGELRPEHFVPHAGAHPLCYSVGFFIKEGPRLRSFTEIFTPEEMRDLLGYGYLLQPDDQAQLLFRQAIDRLWAGGDPLNRLSTLKRLVSLLYPPGASLSQKQRQRLVENELLAVYLHAHMDEDTLNLARLVACPDQVPDPKGRLIPACAYNLFYRTKDPRFWHE